MMATTPPKPKFEENWYSDEQLEALCAKARLVANLSGEVVEVGCWEGKSTIALANACYPSVVNAVDTWEGNVDENPDHPNIQIARDRNVFDVFRQNVAAGTKGNVRPHRMHSSRFFAEFRQPIKFCHIDASHDYESVKRDILGAREWLVPGGILCGDDFKSAGRHRADLGGGVERAVREVLPGFGARRNFWWWEMGRSNRMAAITQRLRNWFR